MPFTTSDNNFGTAKWIVDPVAGYGSHTTISSAITSASSGDVILIRPSSYVENLTLKAGVDLVAHSSDYVNGQVTIVGKLSYSAAGTVNLYNLKLTTNSDYFLEITGANNSVMNIRNCYLNVTNNTGINITCTGASREIVFDGCYGNITTTLISYFTIGGSGAGYLGQGVFFKDCHFRNSGNSTTASTATSTIRVEKSFFMFPLSFTAAGLFGRFSEFSCNNINTTALTIATSNTLDIETCLISSGTASAISIGAGAEATIYKCDISSSNTNVITGAGSIDYSGLTFASTSSNINTTTQTLSEEGPSRTIGSTNTGNTNTLTVTNPSNTASSAASIIASVGGGTAADPIYQAVVSGVTTWTWGADNSVTSPTADPWVLSKGTALGTNNVMSVATSGEINYPLQPAFMAFLPSTEADVTGDGTVFQIGSVTALTEVFDQNGDFNTNGTFTAPVTGRYILIANCLAQQGTALHTVTLRIPTSNATYSFLNNGVMVVGNNGLSCSTLCDMDSADTATISLVSGGSTKTIDVFGGASDRRTNFSGYLPC